MQDYGAVAGGGVRRGPLPSQWNSRKTVFAVGLAMCVMAMCLVALAAQSQEEDNFALVNRRSVIMLAARDSSALIGGIADNIDTDVAEARQDAKVAAAAQNAQSKTGPVDSSIDAAVAEAKKDAQIAAAAAGPVVDAGVFTAEAQKQAAIASKIAAGMGGGGDIDADLALAQKEMQLAEAAAGKEVIGSVPSVDYAAEAKKDLAVAQKDAPAGAADSAEFAEKEAAIAIRDAGGGGGVDEAKAQRAIAVAAAHGENDFVSAARRAADQAMEDAELSGKEPDWAGEAKKELAIAVKAASSMGLANVKMPADESGAAASDSSSSK